MDLWGRVIQFPVGNLYNYSYRTKGNIIPCKPPTGSVLSRFTGNLLRYKVKAVIFCYA